MKHTLFACLLLGVTLGFCIFSSVTVRAETQAVNDAIAASRNAASPRRSSTSARWKCRVITISYNRLPLITSRGAGRAKRGLRGLRPPMIDNLSASLRRGKRGCSQLVHAFWTRRDIL